MCFAVLCRSVMSSFCSPVNCGIYHVSSTCSLVDGHLICFYLLAIVNNVSWTKFLLLMWSPNSEAGLHRAAVLQLWQLMRWAYSFYYITQNTPNITGEERKAWRYYVILSINLPAEKQIPLWLTWFYLESVAEVGNTVTILFLLFHN